MSSNVRYEDVIQWSSKFHCIFKFSKGPIIIIIIIIFIFYFFWGGGGEGRWGVWVIFQNKKTR